MDPLQLVLLAVAGLFAGFVDSIVGGGGVITLPALLAAGLPAHTAVATNKVAGTGASSIATWRYARAGLVEWRLAGWAAPFSVALGVVGAAVVLRLPPTGVTAAIAVVVIAMTAYVLARPAFGAEGPPPVVTDAKVLVLAGIAVAIGFYDGLLGPGTGNLLLFAIVATTGMGFRHAAAHGRVLNFGSNAGALGYFIAVGAIAWAPGLAMAVGTIAGGFVGSQVGIRHGARWIRPLFVAVAAVLIARLLWSLG